MRRTAIAVDKRLVVEHRRGPRTGLKEISGCLKELLARKQLVNAPAFLPNVDFGDRRADVELAQVQERYVLYREIVPTPIEDDGA
jgi:hypothetical protein